MQRSLRYEAEDGRQANRHDGRDQWRQQRFVWNLDHGELRRHDVWTQQRPRPRPSRVQELRDERGRPRVRSGSLQEVLSPSLDYHVTHEREHLASSHPPGLHHPLRRHGSWPSHEAPWNQGDHEEYKQNPPPQVPPLSLSLVRLYSSLESLPRTSQVEVAPSPRVRSGSTSSNEYYGDGNNSPLLDDDTKFVSVDEAAWRGPTETYSSQQAVASSPTIPVKRSRYLRELDRRIILARLDRGEKQAALAKEYKVSRSTICNLYKQRDVVLSRKNENPMSRHPKKSRLLQHQQRPQHQEPVSEIHTEATSIRASPEKKEVKPAHRSAVETRHPEEADLPVAQDEHIDMPPISFDSPTVVEIKSRAIALLLTTIQARETYTTEFRRCCSRLIRLFLEESIATISSVDWAPTSLHEAVLHFPRMPSHQPMCVISLKQPRSHMLDAFRLIHPSVTEGFIRIHEEMHHTSSLSLEGVHLPLSLRGYDVVLLDVVLHSAELACTSIRKLLELSADASRITLVTLFVSSEVVARVQYLHPHVRIMATTIDRHTPQLHHTPRSPGQIFFERFSRTFL